MDVVQRLPDYLRGLPIPSTLDGFVELGQDEILRLLPLAIFLFSLLTLLLLQLCSGGSGGSKGGKGRVNSQHRLKEDKVVDKVKVADVKPAAYCRCWKSKKVRRAACGQDSSCQGRQAGGEEEMKEREREKSERVKEDEGSFC